MKKNKRVIILLSVLILGIGVSLAYFVGKTIFKGTGATTEGRTATINGSTLDISGNIEFKDIDIYPGHQTLSKVTATATGNNELIAYNLTWIGTNDLSTNLKYKVYVSEENKDIELNCEKKKKVVNGAQQLNEVCTSNIEELGEPISEGEISEITEEEQTIKITNTEFITAKEKGTKKYYYIIVEYPDKEDQSIDIGEGFKGKVYGEISNTKADINLVAFYQETEEGKYEEVEEIPKEGYVLNQKETKCNNEEVKVRIENNEIILTNVSKSGTACYLYFSKPTSDKTLAALKLTLNNEIPDFSKTSCEEGCDESTNGVFKGEENGQPTYYFRGTVDNNYVLFAGYYWRIIRINSNGSIRIIYSGTTAGATGKSAQLNNGITQVFNRVDDDNAYVGYMYGETSQPQNAAGYDATHKNTNNSVTKTYIDNWYTNTLSKAKNNGKNATEYIDTEAGFCGDRTPYEYGNLSIDSQPDNKKYGIGKITTYYGAYYRINKSHQPTFDCPNPSNNLYTVSGAETGNKSLTNPIGLITADEVIYAGGQTKENRYYWLYTGGEAYWTISPYYFDGTYAVISNVHLDGGINYNRADNGKSIRPVINLKADVSITGSGTIDSPYEIS